MTSDLVPEFGTAVTTSPGEKKTKMISIDLQVDAANTFWARATSPGCVVVTPFADQFWGRRLGMAKDRCGHV